MPSWMGGCLVWVLEKILLSSVLGEQQWFLGRGKWSWKREFKFCGVGIFSPSHVLRIVWQLIVLLL